MNSLKNVGNQMIPLQPSDTNGSTRVGKPVGAPLNSLDKRDPKMLEAAQAFENQFIRQMISQMRKTVPRDDLVPDSMAENIFREKLDNEYADQWVNQGGVGLADVIYNQLNERFGKNVQPLPKSKDEFLKISPSKSSAHAVSDVLSKKDGNLFLAKKEDQGFTFKSRQALTENVAIHAPFSGLVLQAASLEDGRQMLVVKHDKGLVTQLVHNGRNRVQTGTEVAAGETIAELVPTNEGTPSKIFFGLRKASKTE